MSTNASITVLHSSGKFHGIYNHWDGYTAGLGRSLQANYNSQTLAEELVSFGDMSNIGADTDNCEFYGRDRNEDDVDTAICDTFEEACNNQQYNYLWDGDQWLVDTGDDGKMIPLTIAVTRDD